MLISSHARYAVYLIIKQNFSIVKNSIEHRMICVDKYYIAGNFYCKCRGYELHGTRLIGLLPGTG